MSRISLKQLETLVSNLRLASQQIEDTNVLKSKYKVDELSGENKPVEYAADEEYINLLTIGPVIDELVEGLMAVEAEIKDIHQYIEGQLGNDADEMVLPPTLSFTNPVTGDKYQIVTFDEATGATAVTADEFYVGANSLYVNGKKVLSDESDTINITTSEGQNLKIKTTLEGIIQLSSQAGIIFSSESSSTFNSDIIVDSANTISGSNASLGLQLGKTQVNADLVVTSNINLSGQSKISFGGDSTNTFIAANTDTPEDLEIHADQDLILRPDGNVVVGSTAVMDSTGQWIGPNSGLKGVVGPQGAQGAQGPQGIKGDTGAQGAQGPTGPQGAQGPQGIKGDRGAQGAQGPQGIKGDTGAQGAQGPQGVKGNTGNQGAQGPTGPQGAQGIKGNTGNQGAQGAQGGAGNDGRGISNTFINPGDGALVMQFTDSTQDVLGVVRGSDGAAGAQGPQGPQGAQGPQGPQGIKGNTGTGTQGAQGAQGGAGNDGRGISNTFINPGDGALVMQFTDSTQDVLGVVRGSDGAAGAQGPQGPQGPQGAQGAQGPQGPQGSTGPQGIGYEDKRSLTLHSISTGSKSFGLNTTQYPFVVGSRVRIIATSTQYMEGIITSMPAPGVIVVTVDLTVGGGQFASWDIVLTGEQGEAGVDGISGTSGISIQGAQGAQGPSGPAGSNGSTGAQGAQGPTGPSGSGSSYSPVLIPVNIQSRVNTSVIGVSLGDAILPGNINYSADRNDLTKVFLGTAGTYEIAYSIDGKSNYANRSTNGFAVQAFDRFDNPSNIIEGSNSIMYYRYSTYGEYNTHNNSCILDTTRYPDFSYFRIIPILKSGVFDLDLSGGAVSIKKLL